MALGEPQDCSWAARGWEEMSVFVCCLYPSKATSVKDVAADGTWDIGLVEGAWVDG